MHPARSVILFTTASGVGYGLLIWLGVLALVEAVPQDPVFAGVAFALSLFMISAGLLSSTFHLGHPERAWRAFTQWRSSWLSREGIIATFGYLPHLVWAYGWIVQGTHDGLITIVVTLGVVCALATLYCTSMIYASLRPIHAWHTLWTPAMYGVFALMSSAPVLACLLLLWDQPHLLAVPSMIAIIMGWFIQRRFWHHLDQDGPSSAESATGLGVLGTVSALDPPHSGSNYLLNEMGYRIARFHRERLRLWTQWLGFVVPLLLVIASVALPVLAPTASMATAFMAMAAVLCLGGVACSRWLFFAEARHTVTLYYGQP